LTVADWFKFSLIDELTYEIDVVFQEKIVDRASVEKSGKFSRFFQIPS
jgi:hypothetical protein